MSQRGKGKQPWPKKHLRSASHAIFVDSSATSRSGFTRMTAICVKSQRYKGLPELFEYVIGLVERRQKREIQAIMAFHLLCEILNASEHAIFHYFVLTLNESFLQNPQHGPPYGV